MPCWQEDDFKPIRRMSRGGYEPIDRVSRGGYEPIDRVSRGGYEPIDRVSQGGYGAYNAYISATTRYAALGAPTMYDQPASVYGSKHGNTDIKFILIIKVGAY